MKKNSYVKWFIVIAMGLFVGYLLAEIAMYLIFCKVW